MAGSGLRSRRNGLHRNAHHRCHGPSGRMLRDNKYKITNERTLSYAHCTVTYDPRVGTLQVELGGTTR